MATVEQAIPIAQLRAGTEIEGVFACTRKDRLTARSGSPYLAVELRDSTGAIQARAFRDADFLAGQFDRGDLVAVSGREADQRLGGTIAANVLAVTNGADAVRVHDVAATRDALRTADALRLSESPWCPVNQ